MIKNLSPSRASQFKTCPKQFKFANVDKIKEPTTDCLLYTSDAADE